MITALPNTSTPLGMPVIGVIDHAREVQRSVEYASTFLVGKSEEEKRGIARAYEHLEMAMAEMPKNKPSPIEIQAGAAVKQILEDVYIQSLDPSGISMTVLESQLFPDNDAWATQAVPVAVDIQSERSPVPNAQQVSPAVVNPQGLTPDEAKLKLAIWVCTYQAKKPHRSKVQAYLRWDDDRLNNTLASLRQKGVTNIDMDVTSSDSAPNSDVATLKPLTTLRADETCVTTTVEQSATAKVVDVDDFLTGPFKLVIIANGKKDTRTYKTRDGAMRSFNNKCCNGYLVEMLGPQNNRIAYYDSKDSSTRQFNCAEFAAVKAAKAKLPKTPKQPPAARTVIITPKLAASPFVVAKQSRSLRMSKIMIRAWELARSVAASLGKVAKACLGEAMKQASNEFNQGLLNDLLMTAMA